MTDNNLDIMTQELIYSDFADLIISYRLKGTIEDCFAYWNRWVTSLSKNMSGSFQTIRTTST
jgi:hypothetical protein